MRSKRKWLTAALLLLLIAGACVFSFPETAAAEEIIPEEILPEEFLLEEDIIAEGTLGDNCSWQITGADDSYLLEVNGTGAMIGFSPYGDDRPSWQPYEDAITEVVIGEGITVVGYYDFCEMENLKAATLPATLESIGIDAFKDCKNLETINFPSGLTSIGANAFNGCEVLNADLTFDSGLKVLGDYVFSNCSNVTGVSLPESVTDIGKGAFSGCVLLEKALLPSGLEVINNNLFNGCTNLKEITWPEALTTIYDNAFLGCANLTEVLLPETVIYIGSRVFQDCTGITRVSTPVLSYGPNIFAGCSNLKTVSITGDKAYAIPQGAFLNCESLEQIALPDTISRINEEAFKGCASLKEFPLTDALKEIQAYAFEGCTALSAITIPEAMKSSAIKEGAFNGCENLTIYGYQYTTIEDYANKHKIPFVAIGKTPIHHFETLKIEKEISCTETAAMKFTFYPDVCSKKNVVWKSSNPKVASVDQNGIVTGHRCGYVYIKVSSANSNAYMSKRIFVNYKDVPYSAKKNYYYMPVYWATKYTPITNGIDGISFGIDNPCTRKQFTIFLWKYAGSPSAAGSLNFKDVNYSKNSASYKAILWASSKGIIAGFSDGTFRPEEPVTRKHVLLMLYKMAGKPKVSGTMPFSDVTYKSSSDSYKAILWGTEKQITSGDGNGLFKPDNNCLRKQVVTFLYRYYMLRYR